MPLSNVGHTPVRSVSQLIEIAIDVSERMGAGYAAIARRLRASDRAELADVFDQLAERERSLLDSTMRTEAGKSDTAPGAVDSGELPVFDDDGTMVTAPELLSAYRAYIMAVRNAERVFSFWVYVAAHSPARDVGQMAEKLAHRELQHVAALRKERRRAYHRQREASCGEHTYWTAERLERRFADLVEAEEGKDGTSEADVERRTRHAFEARRRADVRVASPPGSDRRLREITPEMIARGRAIAELLLDYYLELGEHVPEQEERDRAQRYAAELLDCVSAMPR